MNQSPEAKSGVVYVGQELEIPYDEIFLGDPSALVPGDQVKICYLMQSVPNPNGSAGLKNVVYIWKIEK